MQKTDTKNILRFFLKIYRLQLNAHKNEAKMISLSSQDAAASDAIHEFRINHNGYWKSRRISLSPLAEDSGSKSRCFKVIYDDILVVKMPPSPPKTFDQYIESIDRERLNAARLQPNVECITPTVSAILGRIPPFCKNAEGLNPKEFEEKCIQMLKLLPNFQEYLKVGGQFAFFMNLSKFTFLGQVIREMHHLRPKVYKEISEYAYTLEDIVPFEARYGKESTSVFFDMHDVYAAYEDEVRDVLKDQEPPVSVPAYKKRDWFSAFLASNKVEDGDDTLSQELTCDLNNLLEEVTEKHRSAVSAYRGIIINRVYRQVFERNKPQISALVTNLLRMLTILRKKKVAMRDLKPDNVFVAGDIALSPDFLAQVDGYSIGLIDFETAVTCKNSQNIAQPMLSGTPSYATPSHLFKNEVLCQVFDKDLPHILHIQDWQAVLGMIYNVVLGKRLAEKTGHLFPEIMKIIRKTFRENISKDRVFKICSKAFWANASSEFKERLKQNREFLQAVKVEMPRSVRAMFQEEILTIRTDIVKKIRACVYSQQLFKTAKSRKDLIKASTETIRQYRINWENGKSGDKIPQDIRTQVIKLLASLEQLKIRADYQIKRMEILNQRNLTMSVQEILIIMFEVVLNTMYQDEWERVSGNIKASGNDTSCNETTIVCYEKTVALSQYFDK